MFALWLALDAPERVSRLAVVGAPGTALAGTKAGLGLATMATPGINRLLLRAPLPLAATRFALGQAVGSNALKQVPPELVETTHLATKLPGYAGSVSTLLERLLRFRTPRPENVLTDDELRRLSQPILFVWGKNDAILTPEIGHRSIAKMPNAILTVMPGGHEPWLDDAVRCGGLVSSFLRQPQKCSVT